MTETKKILLIGRSGRGKSTLANVLLNNKDDKLKGIFKESGGSVSQTKNIQSEKFRYKFIEQEEQKEITYQVIDTPGIGDTKLSKEEILDIIGEAVYLVKGGVSRVFFVTDGRFDKYETAAYNLLRKAIFDDKITNHTIIVRTKFGDFQNETECEQDINMMKKSDELKEIIESCQKIIHVDNPSILLKEASEEEIELNKSKRSESREILLNHLKETYQENPYNPQNLKDLSEKVYERIEKKKKLGKALEKLEKQLKRVEQKIKNKSLSVIEDLSEEIERESKAIQRAIFEHVQSKVSNDKIRDLGENLEGLSTSRKKLSRPKLTLDEINIDVRLPGINFKAEYQRKKNRGKEKNLDKESISKVNKSEKDTKLSDEVGELVTSLTKKEKWVEKPELIEDTAQEIKKVIDEYFELLGIRNILLIGDEESGKSTLANVLLNKNGNFEEIFKENHWGFSKTKNIQSEEVEINGTWYRIVDNGVVIDDSTSLSSKEIIQEIIKVVYKMRGGISQIFFVFKDWFSEEQIRTFDILKNFILETDTAKLATLIRTNFEHFKDPQAYEKDRENLLAQTQELKEINGIIYVNNPPVIEEEYNEGIRKDREIKIVRSKEEREESGRIVLKHLVENCSKVYELERGKKIGIDVELIGLPAFNAVMEYSKNSSDRKERKVKLEITTSALLINTSMEYQKIIDNDTKEKKIKVGVGGIIDMSLTETKHHNNKEKKIKVAVGIGSGGSSAEYSVRKERKKLPQIQISSEQETQWNWTNLHPSFTSELIHQWQSHNFTCKQCKEWLDIGLQTQDYEYAQWLRNVVEITPEQVLNESSSEELWELFQEYKKQQQAQIQIPPK